MPFIFDLKIRVINKRLFIQKRYTIGVTKELKKNYCIYFGKFPITHFFFNISKNIQTIKTPPF